MTGQDAAEPQGTRTLATAARGAAIVIGVAIVLGTDWRWSVLAVSTGLNLLFRDRFPFSNFPMYARFSPASYTLHVEDESGRRVALRKAFGLTAGALKGFYKRQLGSGATTAARAPLATVEFLRSAARSHDPSGAREISCIRLVRTDLLLRDAVVTSTASVLIEQRGGADAGGPPRGPAKLPVPGPGRP